MSQPTINSRIAGLQQRIRSIQSRWSPAERQRRAASGLRRSRELFNLLCDIGDPDSALVAVGAATCEDWRRLAS